MDRAALEREFRGLFLGGLDHHLLQAALDGILAEIVAADLLQRRQQVLQAVLLVVDVLGVVQVPAERFPVDVHGGLRPRDRLDLGDELRLVVLLAVLDMQRHDALVMLIDEIDGIESGGEEVPDIQIHVDV